MQTVKKGMKKQSSLSSETVQKHPKVRSGYIDLKVSTDAYFPKNKRVNS